MGLGSNSALSQVAHPRRNVSVTLFFPARATIEAASETQAVDGSIDRTWSPVAGLADLSASVTLDRSTERDLVSYTEVATRRIITLNGLYTGIEETMRVRVSQSGIEQIYNITAVGFDSVHETTRLTAEIMSF